MGKKAAGRGVAAKGKQKSLLDGDFDFTKYPQLKKPLETIGKVLNYVPGAFWDKCPEADSRFESPV